jgi:CRISPR-associated protein Cas2
MTTRSFYLLAYDMSDDKRRAKIAKLMESLGERVQGSVFEAYLNAAELQKIVKKSEKIMKMEEDSLRVYFLCEACRPKLQLLGQGKPTPPPDTMIV